VLRNSEEFKDDIVGEGCDDWDGKVLRNSEEFKDDIVGEG
jgi:hypothetical protein